jgi:hypothetical protein
MNSQIPDPLASRHPLPLSPSPYGEREKIKPVKGLIAGEGQAQAQPDTFTSRNGLGKGVPRTSPSPSTRRLTRLVSALSPLSAETGRGKVERPPLEEARP